MKPHDIPRKHAREFAKGMFPTTLYGRYYSSVESLKRKDPIAYQDLLDHLQWGEPITLEGGNHAGYCPKCNGGLQPVGAGVVCPNCGFTRGNPNRNTIQAHDGFHGEVTHPTMFLAGESGPERVEITPEHQNDIFDWDANFGSSQHTAFAPMNYDFSIINYAMQMGGMENHQPRNSEEMNIFNSIMGESVAVKKGKHEDDDGNYNLLDMVESWY